MTEFHGLYKRVLERAAKDVGSLNLEHVVTQSDQVCNCVLIHSLSSLHKSFNLPFLVVARVQLLVARPRRNDLNTGQLHINLR